MLARIAFKIQCILIEAAASSQNWHKFLSLALLSLLTNTNIVWANTFAYNEERLAWSIDNTPELLPPFGKLQVRPWHISKDKITTSEPVAFDASQFDFLSFPQDPQLLSEAPPEYLSRLVQRIEVLLFNKTGVIQFGLSKDTTAAFLKEKTITLGKDILLIQRGGKNEKINLSFIVAHEIAHLVIFNEEIRSGFTPSGYVTAARELGDYSFTADEYKTFVRTVVFPKEAALAHAEVDYLACLILKRLDEPVPQNPLERLMKLQRKNNESSRSLEDEYAERLKALQQCRQK